MKKAGRPKKTTGKVKNIFLSIEIKKLKELRKEKNAFNVESDQDLIKSVINNHLNINKRIKENE